MAAVTPWGTGRLLLKSTNTAGTDQTNAHGIHGGYPGAGSQAILVRGADVAARLAAHALVPTLEGLGGQAEYLPSKSSADLDAGEVLVFHPPGGGGYGDPLDRPVERLQRDLDKGWVSAAMATALYGAALAADGRLDPAATAARRAALRAGRRAAGEGGATRGPWRPPFRVVRPEGPVAPACPACGGGEAILRHMRMGHAGPWAARRYGGDSPNFALAETCCAACGTMLSVEEVRK